MRLTIAVFTLFVFLMWDATKNDGRYLTDMGAGLSRMVAVVGL